MWSGVRVSCKAAPHAPKRTTARTGPVGDSPAAPYRWAAPRAPSSRWKTRMRTHGMKLKKAGDLKKKKKKRKKEKDWRMLHTGPVLPHGSQRHQLRVKVVAGERRRLRAKNDVDHQRRGLVLIGEIRVRKLAIAERHQCHCRMGRCGSMCDVCGGARVGVVGVRDVRDARVALTYGQSSRCRSESRRACLTAFVPAEWRRKNGGKR